MEELISSNSERMKKELIARIDQVSNVVICRLHCRSLEDMLQFSLQHRAQLTWITEYTSVRDLGLSLERLLFY